MEKVDARSVAWAALALGAGRAAKGDAVDHRVGVVLRAKVGAHVEEGDVLVDLHARDDATAARAASEIISAYSIINSPVPPSSISLERLGAHEGRAAFLSVGSGLSRLAIPISGVPFHKFSGYNRPAGTGSAWSVARDNWSRLWSVGQIIGRSEQEVNDEAVH